MVRGGDNWGQSKIKFQKRKPALSGFFIKVSKSQVARENLSVQGLGMLSIL